jgi:uncharacterized protein YejL (UPF0352 family)
MCHLILLFLSLTVFNVIVTQIGKRRKNAIAAAFALKNAEESVLKKIYIA